MRKHRSLPFTHTEVYATVWTQTDICRHDHGNGNPGHEHTVTQQQLMEAADWLMVSTDVMHECHNVHGNMELTLIWIQVFMGSKSSC